MRLPKFSIELCHREWHGRRPPRGYGLYYTDQARRCDVFMIMPFNVIAGWCRDLVTWMLRGGKRRRRKSYERVIERIERAISIIIEAERDVERYSVRVAQLRCLVLQLEDEIKFFQ